MASKLDLNTNQPSREMIATFYFTQNRVLEKFVKTGGFMGAQRGSILPKSESFSTLKLKRSFQFAYKTSEMTETCAQIIPTVN